MYKAQAQAAATTETRAEVGQEEEGGGAYVRAC